MYIVYKHTCKVNGKSYVGVTSGECDNPYHLMERRWRGHLKFLKRSSNVFHRAIKKHGIEQFEHELLGIYKTREIALKRECYWIEFFDTFKNGYNMTPGGDGVIELSPASRLKHKQSLKRTYSKPEVRKRNSIAQKKRFSDPAEKIKISERTKAAMTPERRLLISKKARGRRPWNKGISSSKESIDKMRMTKKANKKPSWRRIPVSQYDGLGNHICDFSSISEASKATGVAHTGIGLCVRGIYVQSGGFVWKRSDA